MQYSRLIWTHDVSEFPIEVFSEYDADGWETRKVEVFADGSYGFAGGSEGEVGAKLSLIRRPPDGEVNAAPEYRTAGATALEFERLWKVALQRASIPH